MKEHENPSDPNGRPRTTGRIETLSDEEFERTMRRSSRRAFLVGGVAALAGIGGWKWLTTRERDDGIPWPLRDVMQGNEKIARAYFEDSHLSRTYPVSAASMPRVNGDIGLGGTVDPSTWRMRVVGLTLPTRFRGASPTTDTTSQTTDDPDSLYLTLDDIRALPRTEIVTELRCIEGWSVVVRWGGARFSDFAAKYRTGTIGAAGRSNPFLGLPDYVSLETPDGGYFVGLDIASAMHPQTLLCYEMDGRPLTSEHGAPLRLATPTKYGVKNLKRIGTIRFTDVRPPDYWAKRGYDWYAGL